MNTQFLPKFGRKLGTVLAVLGLCSFSSLSYAAAHSTYNPMQPRQLSAVAAQADYSYGYSILSGHALDSLEEPNRAMWYLNYDIFDHYILRPVAHGYAYLPQGVQNSMGNFFANLDEVNNIPNNIFVGDVGGSAVSLGRLVVNSTIGLLGFFDVATQMGLNAHPMNMETGKWALQGVHNRAQLIPQEGMVDNAMDPYITTRDSFLMYDENAVNPVQEGVVESEDDFDEALLDEIDG